MNNVVVANIMVYVHFNHNYNFSSFRKKYYCSHRVSLTTNIRILVESLSKSNLPHTKLLPCFALKLLSWCHILTTNIIEPKKEL